MYKLALLGLATTATAFVPHAAPRGFAPRRARAAAAAPMSMKFGVDLSGKTAFIAGVADSSGYGWAIAKALAEAGATITVGTWPPVLGIFKTSLDKGRFDDDMKLSDGSMMKIEKARLSRHRVRRAVAVDTPLPLPPCPRRGPASWGSFRSPVPHTSRRPWALSEREGPVLPFHPPSRARAPPAEPTPFSPRHSRSRSLSLSLSRRSTRSTPSMTRRTTCRRT